MTLSTQRMRTCLQAFDFKRLFVEELGWNNYSSRITPTEIGGVTYSFAPVAQQGGMVVVTCTASDGNIPPTGTRRKIDQYISGVHFEHLILFLDRDAQGTPQTSLWWWVKREDGKIKPRTFTYRRGSMGDALLQKLAGIAFEIEDLDEEGSVSIATVTSRFKSNFDVEGVTKKFYDQFKAEHAAFSKFLVGVEDAGARDWYVSVMLNRLMFLYFVQRKRFLNSDPDYLRTKLAEIQEAGLNFYRDFLLVLFFQGLACEEAERDAETNHLLGTIPYLNGGLFLPHPIEDQYGEQIVIANGAFDRLFDFFKKYDWHLDERPLRQGNEINPDVLGYIFEKYINQKQMGAYYTKEDITGYICRSTILPFLLDKCGVDIRAILTDIDPYIYEAVATADYLPTETEREYVARRQRYESIQADFAGGKIATVDDLVTYNLNIQELIEDWLRTLDDPVLLRRFYFECLSKLTVLDPTCGSGAFLFAAMNILEPLYDLALDKMRQIVGAPEDAPSKPSARENVVKYLDFVDELRRVSAHPNRAYFTLKSIIVNNLYGVDIMDEAVEICKLRLFLKLVAQVDTPAQIEPLPDIDFNIRAGNTLVGFATRGEIEGRLFATPELKRKVEDADRALRNFRELQTRVGIESGVFKKAKRDIQAQLSAISADLDRSLMEDYGLSDLNAFCASHKPFHWYLEFNSVMANGGFNVIVGNPPYVQVPLTLNRALLRDYYSTALAKWSRDEDLYVFVVERSLAILNQSGGFGMILPLSIAFSTKKSYALLREMIRKTEGMWWWSHFDRIPSALFGNEVRTRCTIAIFSPDKLLHKDATTSLLRWNSDARDNLFNVLSYASIYTNISTRIPKVDGQLQADVLSELLKLNSSLDDDLQRSVPYSQLAKMAPNFPQSCVFVGGTAYNWFPAWREIPETTDVNGRPSLPARTIGFEFSDEQHADVVFAILCSSLGYWWWAIASDGFNLKKWLITSLPFGTSMLSQAGHQELSRLGKQLRTNLRSQYVYKDNKGRIGNFYLPACDDDIRAINACLTKHVPILTEEFFDDIYSFSVSFSRNEIPLGVEELVDDDAS